MPFSRGSSQPRDGTCILCIAGSLYCEPPGKPRRCGCMGQDVDPSVISRCLLINDTQWPEIFPSEDLGGNPGTCTGEHGASYARTWTPCLLRGGAGQDTPSWGSTVSASLSPAAAVVQELEKPACLPAAASSRLTWAHVCQYIRIFLKNNIPRGPGMSQQDRVGRRV